MSIELISGKATSFIESCRKLPPPSKLSALEAQYRVLKNQYESFQRDYSSVFQRMANRDMDHDIIEMTTLSDDVDTAWHEFEDTLQRSRIGSSIDQIRGEGYQLMGQCLDAISEIRPGSKLDELARQHAALKQRYDGLNRKMQTIFSTIPEEDSAALERVSEDFQPIFAAWDNYQDTLLTASPQTAIDYGTPLRQDLSPSIDLQMSEEVKALFPYYRQVRGDGNCFYTSFSISYLQWLCQHPNHFEQALQRVLELPPYEGRNEMIQLILDLQENPASLESILGATKPPRLMICISFLRHCAAHQMTQIDRDWQEFYNPELQQDAQTPQDYVANHVLRMGCDAQDYEINALANYLGCQLWIADEERRTLSQCNEQSPMVSVLYRFPGHYACLQHDERNSAVNISPEHAHRIIDAQLAESIQFSQIRKIREQETAAAVSSDLKPAAASSPRIQPVPPVVEAPRAPIDEVAPAIQELRPAAVRTNRQTACKIVTYAISAFAVLLAAGIALIPKEPSSF